MQKKNPLPIVDLFAGPGGLGEGFSALNNGKTYEIVSSVEMDPYAHKTLRLRAFFRLLKNHSRNLDSYYKYCNGVTEKPWDYSNEDLWIASGKEAILAELGTTEGNKALNESLKEHGITGNQPWILIGGPPCQAYSLAGRAKNRSNKNYNPETDKRNFLYKEYLSVVRKYSPAVFVMENVKGILSSKISGDLIFHSILRDLAKPYTNDVGTNHSYKIYSLVSETFFEHGMNPNDIEKTDFIIESEKFGIPQARHRVILLGVRDDIPNRPEKIQSTSTTSIRDVIDDLPKIRSALSKKSGEVDSPERWVEYCKGNITRIINESADREELDDIRQALINILKNTSWPISRGANIQQQSKNYGKLRNTLLKEWYLDKDISVVLNHESRGHKPSDLRRYIYASCFADLRNHSPKGLNDFDLDCLTPDHKNWSSGKFKDRFRVQLKGKPGDTLVSHISNDGHQFIHYDPTQCRTLTVREAARVQTFPDNYFFQGPRSQQYRQVGNAVPPLLANKIALIVEKLLRPESTAF